MSTAVWIVIAVVVVLVVVALAFVLSRKRRDQQRVEAGRIREGAADRASEVEEQEAIAEETAAKARRAQADADAKAAEAKRLSFQADKHQGTAASSRDELDAEFERANKIDPDVRTGKHETADNSVDEHGRSVGTDRTREGAYTETDGIQRNGEHRLP